MDKLHITIMIDTLSVGGAERLQLTFAKAIKDYPIKLTLVSMAFKGTSLLEEFHALGIETFEFQGSTLLDPKRLWKLIQFFRSHTCDVLHCHLTTANVLGTIVGRLLGIPVIATLHNVAFKAPGEKNIRVWLETFTLRYLTPVVVAIGYTVAKVQQTRLGNKKIHVIPNAVPSISHELKQNKSQAQIDLLGFSAEKLIIAVGRLQPQKAFADLIDAFAIVSQTQPAAHLIIVGGGELKENLESQVQRLNLEDKIKLLGIRQDVPQLLTVSDLFVMSSHWEGLPLAILESMSAGIPIVATDVGDVPNIVTDDIGIIVPAKSPDKLAEAILQMIADPQKLQQFGEAAYLKASTEYSTDAWIQRIFDLYREFHPTINLTKQETT